MLVDQYFNDSTGEGDEGDTDARGPWNEGGAWQIVEVAELKHGVENLESANGEAWGAQKSSGPVRPSPKPEDQPEAKQIYAGPDFYAGPHFNTFF